MTINAMAKSMLSFDNSINTFNSISNIAKNMMDNIQKSSAAAPKENPFNYSLFSDLGDIRSSAAELQSAIMGMSSLSQFSSSIDRTAVYSDDKILSADVGKNAPVSRFTTTNVEVKQLAQTQVNQGAVLAADVNNLGDSFDLSITDSSGKTQSFSVEIKENETNLDAMKSMAEQINSSDAGVKASLIESDGNVSLRLEGTQTGELGGGFTVVDNSAADMSNVERTAQNAVYSVGGREMTSQTNEGVQLQSGVTADLKATGSVQLTYRHDTEAATAKVQQFVDTYNKMRESVLSSSMMTGQMDRAARTNSHSLGFSGITVDSSGSLKISDATKLANAISDGSFVRNFQGVTSFGNNIRDITRNAYSVMYSETSRQGFNQLMKSTTSGDSSGNIFSNGFNDLVKSMTNVGIANMITNTNAQSGLLFSLLV
ncbi:MAG: flagellar filament capping protein FliD [Oscillospiraceae bacterium]|nr:flagellar filament capping protein FliD [Oscillospiraceae bacterium]